MGEVSSNVFQRYPAKSVFVSSGSYNVDQTQAGTIQQLSRIQDVGWSINYGLSDNPYLDGGIEPIYPLPASIEMGITWDHTNGQNEWYLGLAQMDASGDLSLGLDQEKSLYISVEDSLGTDSIGADPSSPRTVIGMAQTVMTSYGLSARVGGRIQGQASFNSLTAFVYTGGSGQQMAAVNPQDGAQLTGHFVLPAPTSMYNRFATGVTGLPVNVAAIGAQDMILTFPKTSPFGVTYTGYQAVYLQSFDLSLDINRQELKPLGYVYPPNRAIVYPLAVSLSTEAIVSKYQADQLRRFNCLTSTGFSVNMIVKQPCQPITMFGFYFTDLQLQSQSFGTSIGSMDTVSSQWRGWIKSPSDAFFDPFYNVVVRLDTTGEWGAGW